MIDCDVFFNRQNNYQNGAHAHLDDMLFVPLSGKFSVTEQGSNALPQRLSMGSIYLAPRRKIHSFQSTGSQEHLCYYLDVSSALGKLPESGAVWSKSIYLSSLAEIRRQLFIRSRGAQTYEATSVDDLIVREVHRIFSVISPIEYWTEAAVVEQVCVFVDRNMANVLTVQEIAEEFGLATRTLARWFAHHKGISLGRHIQTARLNRAKDLLCSTEMPVAQIQAIVGFDSAAHFSYAFKLFFKISPSEMRNGYKLAENR